MGIAVGKLSTEKLSLLLCCCACQGAHHCSNGRSAAARCVCAGAPATRRGVNVHLDGGTGGTNRLVGDPGHWVVKHLVCKRTKCSNMTHQGHVGRCWPAAEKCIPKAGSGAMVHLLPMAPPARPLGWTDFNVEPAARQCATRWLGGVSLFCFAKGSGGAVLDGWVEMGCKMCMEAACAGGTHLDRRGAAPEGIGGIPCKESNWCSMPTVQHAHPARQQRHPYDPPPGKCPVNGSAGLIRSCPLLAWKGGPQALTGAVQCEHDCVHRVRWAWLWSPGHA